MGRTHGEIKKVLNDPIPVHFHIGDPEPRLTPLAMVDLEELHADALALIQQLQDDNAQLNRCIENMTDKLNAMNDEVAKLQAERDAAVADIRLAFTSYVGTCRTCKHGKNQVDCIEPLRCGNCENEKCKCQSCDSNDSNWEWRGVTKE